MDRFRALEREKAICAIRVPAVVTMPDSRKVASRWAPKTATLFIFCSFEMCSATFQLLRSGF
jgi:hypothetical protein